MPTTEHDYINVVERAAQLGCHLPSGFAIVPDNFATAPSRQELLMRGEGSTIRTLFRNHDMPLEDFLPKGERPRFVHNKSHDWAAFIFVSAALLSENPALVSLALNVIANYLTDSFKGLPSKKIKLDIAVERKGNSVSKRLTYEGDVAGLKEIADTVLRIGNE